jgi:hypothetical protein
MRSDQRTERPALAAPLPATLQQLLTGTQQLSAEAAYAGIQLHVAQVNHSKPLNLWPF